MAACPKCGRKPLYKKPVRRCKRCGPMAPGAPMETEDVEP